MTCLTNPPYRVEEIGAGPTGSFLPFAIRIDNRELVATSRLPFENYYRSRQIAGDFLGGSRCGLSQILRKAEELFRPLRRRYFLDLNQS